MKQRIVILSLALLLGVPPNSGVAQEKKEPESKLIEFQMALMKRGPKWQPIDSDRAQIIQSVHRAYVRSLLGSGQAVIAGPLHDDGDILGVYVLRAKSADEAKAWVENDPAVKAGHMIAEMHPWWSEDVMKKPTLPIKMTTAYLGFLKRGAKWTPEKTAASAELQKAHLANINRLAETKKLVVAGPFGDNGPLRGIFVFRVGSLAEAKQLADTDPSVQAGRLAIEMHPWLVPEGILP